MHRGGFARKASWLCEGDANGASEVDSIIEEQDCSGCLLNGLEEDEAEDSSPSGLKAHRDEGVHYGPYFFEEHH